MSYYQFAKEEFVINNVNEDTAAFTKSVKKYLQDFLKGVRIQVIQSFYMELTVNEKLIIGEFVKGKGNNGVIQLQSIQLDETEMNHVVLELENYQNIHLRLSYAAFFFYFYPFGINRFGELLQESLQGYVTFTAMEEQEDVLRGYQFRDYDGQLVNGLIKDQDYRNYSHIEEWKMDQFYFDLHLKEPISWETYYKVEKEAYRIGAKYGLGVEYEAYPSFASGEPMADPGEVIFERPYIQGTYDYARKTMTFKEMESFYEDVLIIYTILRDHVSMLCDQMKLIPLHKEHGEPILRMKIDEEKNLVLSVFDPSAKNLEYTPYGEEVNGVKSMEAFFEKWDVQVPFPEETLE